MIAFDTSVLCRRNRYQGLYVYARRLLQEFERLPVGSPVLWTLFVGSGLDSDANEFLQGGHFRAAHSGLLKRRHIWRCGGAAVAAYSSKADLLFSPTPYVLPLGLVPVVATIADTIPLKVPPEMFFRASLHLQRALCFSAARWSRKIITLSECSKRDIVEAYRISPEKITVIYCGYDRELFNSDTPDEAALRRLRDRFAICQPYIFSYGTIQPRKNFQRLIESYGQVMDRNRNFDIQLVIGGSFGWQYEPIVRAGNELKGRGKVIFTGPLPDKDLALLLKGSIASVIPSLYEGFCLPMVESMACGVPTITANTSCLPEVSGCRLRYFDPLSVEDMASSIQEVLENPSLRRQLADDGVKRASAFSWERCARETLDLLTNP